MASFNASLNTEKSVGNSLIRTQSNTVSNQGQEGTCYAHTVARIFSRLIKVNFSHLFSVTNEECNIYYSKKDCDNNIFSCFEKEPKCGVDLDDDGMPTENISALLYVYLYKLVRNEHGCHGKHVHESLKLLIDFFKDPAKILNNDIISTVLLHGDTAYNIDSSPKRAYLYKLIDRLLNIIMVIKQRVANDEIILRRSLPICTTRICPLPTDYYPEVFNAMNITGYYAGLTLLGVTDSRGRNLAHAVTLSGFGFDADNDSPQLIIKNSWGAIRDWSNVIKDNKVTLFDLPDQVRLFITYVYFKSDEERIRATLSTAQRAAADAETTRKYSRITTDDGDGKKADKDMKKATDWILPQIQDRDIAKNIELLRNLVASRDTYIKAAAFGLLADLAETPANIDNMAKYMEVLVGGLQCKELILGSCHDGIILARARENAARALWNVVSLGNNADDPVTLAPQFVIERMVQSHAIEELVIALDTGGPKIQEYALRALAAITTSKMASNVILRIKKAITTIFGHVGPNRNIEIQLNAIKVILGLVKHEEYRFAIAAVGIVDVLNELAASSNEEIKQIATETLVLLEPYNNPERLKSQASTMADHLFIETFEYDIPKAHAIMYDILSEKPNLIINEGTMRYIVYKVNGARVKAPAMKVLVDKMRSDDFAIELLSNGVSAAMLITLAHNCARSPRDPNSNRVLVPAVTALSKMRPYGRGAHPIFIEENDIIRFIELVMTEPFINATGESIDIRPMAIAALKHFLVEEDYRDQYRPNTNKFIEFITTATKKLVNILASGEITDAKRLMAVDTLYNMVGPKTTTGDNPYNIIIPLAIANTEKCILTLIRLLASVNEEVKLSAVKLLWRLALANYIALADAGALANYKAFADAWELSKYKAFADEGTIRALTDALRAGQHNFKSWAAGVLGIITDTDDNIRKLVNDSGAIPLLIAIASSHDQTGNDYNTFANGALRSLAENVDFATAIRNAGYTITINGGGKTRKHQTHNQNKTNKKNKPNKTNKKTLPSKTRASRKNRNGGRR